MQGNCSLEKQIPTLRLLLDFIKSIFIESSEIKYDIKKSTDDILNVINKYLKNKYII